MRGQVSELRGLCPLPSGNCGSLHLGVAQVAGSSTGEPSGDIPRSEALGGEAHDLFIAFFGQKAGAPPVGFGLRVPTVSPALRETLSVALLSTFQSPLFLESRFVWLWGDSEITPLPTVNLPQASGP